jgi:hypothetical protein
MAWRVLAEAGAPHDAIARWCVDKLRQKERDAPNLDGPLGIVATRGEILQANGWQLAFKQARQALDWLLDHGDEGAVTVLADACFAPDAAERTDPVVAKYVAGLVVPLSQVIWGRTIGRPAGRAALCARVERGAGTGESAHFLGGVPAPSGTEDLWVQVAIGLAVPILDERHVPSATDQAEAQRMLLAFEAWIDDPSATFWRREPSRGPWADPGARRAKALIVLTSVLHGIDVSGPLQVLLRSMVDDRHAHEAGLLTVLAVAIDHVCGRPEGPPAALLTLAATPQIAAALATDEAGAFWLALLRTLGIGPVMDLLDTLALPDAGLGVFDALAGAAPDGFDRLQLRPDLLRSVLVRSAEGHFTASPAFHEQAWARPRHPEEIRDLDRIPAGDWLLGLVEQSRAWPDGARTTLLRWLARRSVDPEVRGRCVAALLE